MKSPAFAPPLISHITSDVSFAVKFATIVMPSSSDIADDASPGLPLGPTISGAIASVTAILTVTSVKCASTANESDARTITSYPLFAFGS